MHFQTDAFFQVPEMGKVNGCLIYLLGPCFFLLMGKMRKKRFSLLQLGKLKTSKPFDVVPL